MLFDTHWEPRLAPNPKPSHTEKKDPNFKTSNTDFLRVISGGRSYSPELGRWLNLDPIGEQGGWNLYAACKNRQPNGFDVLGLWVLFFESDFSDADFDKIVAAFNYIKSNMPAMLARLDEWRIAASQLPDDCAFKMRFSQELVKLYAILTDMADGLNSSEVLFLYTKEMSEDTWAEVGMPWSLGKSNTFNGKMYFNINRDNSVSSWGQKQTIRTVFHELLHVAGVPKEGTVTDWWSADALAVEVLIERPSSFSLINCLNFLLLQGYDNKCCPGLGEWVP